MLKCSRILSFILALQCLALSAFARPDASLAATITDKTAGAQKLAGYFNLYWDAKQGKALARN